MNNNFEHNKKLYKKGKKKSLFALAVLLICVLIFIFTLGLFSEFSGGNQKGEEVKIVIKSGVGTKDISELLKENNVIENPLFFRIVSKILSKDGEYKEGVFHLYEGMSYSEIMTKLTGAPDAVDTVKITIPEGYEFHKIAELFEECGLIDKEEFTEVAQTYDFGYDFLKDLPQREFRLEGYIFPDTYLFEPRNTAIEILDVMLSRFDEIYTEEYKARTKELNMTIDEVVTLASIIEREAQGDHDRDKVASVFHNRLKNKTYPYLESCATVQYILKERKAVLSNKDTKIDSPYNTYIYPGLPLGPIASPGEKSIKAALYPENTNYLFFVLDSSGTHQFAETFEGHLQNQNK